MKGKFCHNNAFRPGIICLSISLSFFLSLLLLSIFLCLSLFCSLSLSWSFVCKQPGLRIRDRMRFEFRCTCYGFLAELLRFLHLVLLHHFYFLNNLYPVKHRALVACCVWETLNQREKQGARGRIDGTGQRRPIYVVVKTYLQIPSVRNGKVAKPKTTHADMPWHDMTCKCKNMTWHVLCHLISPSPFGSLPSVSFMHPDLW